MCLGEIQNTPVVCSELCSLPTVANIQKVLSLLVNLASKCLFMDAAICFVFFNNNRWCRDRNVGIYVCERETEKE